MRQKYLVITGFCTLAGIALGYWSGYVQGKSVFPDKDEEDAGPVRNRFGRSPVFERGGKKISPSLQKPDSRSGLLDMDSLFSRYKSMTPDQIRDAVAKLQEMIDNENIPPEEANTILYALCYRWGQLSPRQALAYADSLTTGMSFCHAAIIRGWSAENPEAAVSYYQENKKDSPRSGSILEIIARGMAHAAPDGAVKWLNSLEEKDKRRAFPAVLACMAREHPERLADFTSQISPETLDRYGLVSTLTRHWTSCDWDAARQWINALPASMKEKAMEEAIDTLVFRDVEQATLAWKELSGDRKQQMTEHIVRKLADQSAIRSLEWIDRHADESRALALTGHVVNYSNSASRELKDYALGMPEGARKDYILGQIVNMAASYHFQDSHIDCAENMALTDSIKDPETRIESRRNMIHAWAQENPEQAAQWLSSVPEKEQNEYLEKYEAALRQIKR